MREQGLTAKFMSDDGVVTDELATTAGGPQYVKGVLMTFGADPRLIPDGKAVVEKFRAGGFEPEGYTLLLRLDPVPGGGLQRAGANDPAKAAEWLKSHPVQTVMGKKNGTRRAT